VQKTKEITEFLLSGEGASNALLETLKTISPKLTSKLKGQIISVLQDSTVKAPTINSVHRTSSATHSTPRTRRESQNVSQNIHTSGPNSLHTGNSTPITSVTDSAFPEEVGSSVGHLPQTVQAIDIQSGLTMTSTPQPSALSRKPLIISTAETTDKTVTVPTAVLNQHRRSKPPTTLQVSPTSAEKPVDVKENSNVVNMK